VLKTYELSKISAQRSRRWSNRKVNRRARTRACVHIDTPWHILRRFEECSYLEEEIEKMEDAIDGVRNHKTLWFVYLTINQMVNATLGSGTGWRVLAEDF